MYVCVLCMNVDTKKYKVRYHCLLCIDFKGIFIVQPLRLHIFLGEIQQCISLSCGSCLLARWRYYSV